MSGSDDELQTALLTARLDHVTVSVSDLDAALRFYAGTLGALGLVRVHELVDEEEDDAAIEAVAFGPEDGSAVIWVVHRRPATAGLHLALRVPSRESVDDFHAAALAAGGTSHDAPRRWPIFRRGEYNAIVADPDGNLIEAIAPE